MRFRKNSRISLHFIFLFLLLSLLNSSAFSQQYPVQGSLIINTPYPAYLSDYANPNIEKLVLNLTLTDINLSNKRVKLKVFIQQQNTLIAQSNDVIIGEPVITLDGGIPQRYPSAELSVYFRQENLSTPLWGAGGLLAEGVYTIWFEVYDYFTGNKLSDKISQQFWLMLSDPPLLNMPRNRENITEFLSGSLSPSGGAGGGIVFQWTPRSTQVSNTEYEFTLSELWDDAGDPYQQFLAATPKYKVVTNTTTLLYGIAEPPLLAGRTYAWRVRAKAKAGFEDIGLYRQDGYSEVFLFKYAGQCPAVQGINIEIKGYDRAYITWNANAGQSLYKVAYRKYTTSRSWEWHEIETFSLYLNLVNLEGNTEYEIKVGGVCADGSVAYTSPLVKRTLHDGQIAGIDCGVAPVIDLSNKTLIAKLQVNDVVMANDFPVVLTKVEGTPEGWSGEGWTKMKWLGDIKLRLVYTGIKVNTDMRLIDGFFETTYNPDEPNVASVDEFIEDVKELIREIINLIDNYKGTEKDKKEIAKAHEEIKKEYTALLQNNFLSEPEKEELKKLYAANEYCWDALKQGKPCPVENSQSGPGHGPVNELYITIIEENYDCYKKGAKEVAEKIKSLSEKASVGSDNYLVKVKKLLDWIKSNKGNARASYKIEDFFYGLNEIVSTYLPIHIPIEGVSKELDFDIQVSFEKEAGELDLSLENSNKRYSEIGCAIDFSDKNHTGFYLLFNLGGSSQTALKLWAYSYTDYEKLLNYLGLSLPESSKKYFSDKYSSFLMAAGNDCDKIDKVYETIPPFVIENIADDDLWRALKVLSVCSMNGGTGTDEEQAALNILRAFKDKKRLYENLKADNKTTIELYKGIDGDNCYAYLNILADLCDAYGADVANNQFAYLGKVPSGAFTEQSELIYNNKDYITTVSSSPPYRGIKVESNIGNYTLSGVQNLKSISQFSPESFLDKCILYRNDKNTFDVLPVIYLGHLAEKDGDGKFLEAVNKASIVFGLTNSARVLFSKGAGYIAKAIAFTEISKVAMDVVMQDTELRQSIASWGPEGKWLVDNWKQISITVDLTTLGSDFLNSFIQSSAKVSGRLRVRGYDDAAQELEEIQKVAAAAEKKVVAGTAVIASQFDIQASLSIIANLKSTNKLTKSIGSASDVELAAIHKYTENGGVLNNAMRNGSETVLGPVAFTEFQSQVYQSVKSGLKKLRQTNRLVTGTVIRGRTYTLADFNALFKSGSTNVPLKGMVSCTKNEAVAVDFLSKSGANLSGPKVKVIMKIKSKNGVDIDDFSDWGANLVNQRHQGELIQEEVLLEEGMFKMIDQPRLILENGVPKFDPDGVTPWIEVELEELATPLRNIN